jgi:hypothetical protein
MKLQLLEFLPLFMTKKEILMTTMMDGRPRTSSCNFTELAIMVLSFFDILGSV